MLKIVMKCQCCRQAKNLFPSLYAKANFRDDWVYPPGKGLSVSLCDIFTWMLIQLCSPLLWASFLLLIPNWGGSSGTERGAGVSLSPLIPSTPHSPMLFDFGGAGGQENPPRTTCSFQCRSGIVLASWRRLWSLKRFLQPLWAEALLPTVNCVHLSAWICPGASPG